MQFMLLMIPKGYETAPPGIDLDPARVETMMKFNADLQKAGILLALNGLHPPSSGARISFKSGQPTVTNGPFAGTSDVLGGLLDHKCRIARRSDCLGKTMPGCGQ